jgi:hypothetical protein
VIFVSISALLMKQTIQSWRLAEKYFIRSCRALPLL